MVVDRIFKNEIVKAMEKSGCTEISNLHISWNDEKKVLVTVEKDSKKGIYEVSAIKVFLVGDKMRKISETTITDNSELLESILSTKIHNVSRITTEGVVIRDRRTALHMLLTVNEETSSNPFNLMPQALQPAEITDYSSAIGHVCDHNLEVTNIPIILSEEALLHHVLITGSSGGGKTEVAKRIVSRIERKEKSILVITPEPHLWKSLDNSFLISGDFELKKGISIADFSSVSSFAEEASDLLESVIEHYSQQQQTNNLKLLLVVDEAHLLLDKEDYQNVLEKTVRILRKFGVGCVLISQTYTDFSKGIRANIQTHIAMYTNWQRDLSYIRAFQPDGNVDYAKLLLSMPEGYGIFRSRDFLRNQPVPCKFLLTKEEFQIKDSANSNELPVSETYQRRMEILSIIKQCVKISVDQIRDELLKKGFFFDSSTISRDLAWLESQDEVRVVEVGERGRKYYGTK